MAGDWRIADGARHSGRLAAHADVVVAYLFSFMAKGERASYCDVGPTPLSASSLARGATSDWVAVGERGGSEGGGGA